MLFAILGLFLLAGFAPVLCRRWPAASGALLALAPLAVFGWLLTGLSVTASGGALHSTAFAVPELGVAIAFRLDGLSMLFALLISGIGALVVLYAGAYLHEHPHRGRFQCFLLLFMASMLGLVLADNLIALFIFWELTSVTSYLLIGFESGRAQARAAALQALLVTGFGGLFLLAGLLLLGAAAGTHELSALGALRGELVAHPWYRAILGLVLVGAFTKSAQMPFHFWLPRAMEAPTPASAFLHSSTMVKAGLYLVARLHPALGGTPEWTTIIPCVGGATMLLAAVMAIGQTVLKPLLAWSTVSALGAIMLLLGGGSEATIQAALAFLLAHAFYKAALFLVAGAIDHETGQKDTEKLGGLRRHMPFTAAAAGIAALSMAGLPPFLGFVAKELLYEGTLHGPWPAVAVTAAAVVAGMFFLCVAALTGIRPFWGALRETPRHPHEAPLAMRAAPLLLAVGSLTIGLLPHGPGQVLLAPAVSAVLGRPADMHLALWHGVNLPLLLSLATVLGGLGVYAARHALRRAAEPLRRLARVGPERGYDVALQGMIAIAAVQTRLLQNGRLRNYLFLLLLTTTGVAYYGLLGRGLVFTPPPEWLALRPLEFGLGLVILVAVVASVAFRTRLAAIAALGVVGYGVCLLFTLHGAPDLAMTQFAVETLTLVLLVLAFHHLPPYANLSSRGERARDGLIAVAMGGLMSLLVLFTLAAQRTESIADYFLQEAVGAAHGRNVVNVILVDFRAMDTLGEITVLALAGIGGYALLKCRRPGRREDA